MDQQTAYDIKVGEACNRLISSEDFKVFLEEVSRRRNIIAEQTLVGKAEDYAEYLAARGVFIGLTEVMTLPQFLSDAAAELLEREQNDE